jgi:hypothetical protein
VRWRISPYCKHLTGRSGRRLPATPGSTDYQAYYDTEADLTWLADAIATTHNDNYELFSNVQTNLYYWSTEAAWNANYAWAFGFNNCGGCVDAEADKIGSLYAWAVHSGNAGAVPLPAAVVLFGSGLLGFMGVAGRKQRARQLLA